MALTIPNTFTTATPAVAAEVNGNFTAVKTLLDSVETTTNSNSTNKVDKSLTLNAQTGTTYTLALTDSAKFVTLSNAAAIALSIPTDATVAFPTGTQVNIVQLGDGQVTIGGSPAIRSQGSKYKLNGKYSAATLIKIAANEWVIVGNTAA